MAVSIWFPRWVVGVCLTILADVNASALAESRPYSNQPDAAFSFGRPATPLAAGLGSGVEQCGADSPSDQNEGGSYSSTRAAERGRAIYWEGRHSDGSVLSALTGSGGVPLPTRFTACVHCHGHDARGKTEGGVTASDIRGETLSKTYEVTLPNGRRRAVYDAASFFAALTRGIDSTGQTLNPSMPRYQLSAAEAEDVFTYLDQVARLPSPGVADEGIRIGFLTTKDPDFAASVQRDRQLIAAYIDDVNRQGGIFRRRIELVDTDETAGANSEPTVLAIITTNENAPETGGSDRAALLPEKPRVPLLRITARSPENDEHVSFSLFPGRVERAHTLVRYAVARDHAASRSIALIYSPKSVSPVSIEKLIRITHSLTTLEPAAIDRTTIEDTVHTLRASGIDDVLLVGPGTDFVDFVASVNRLAWEPLLLWTDQPTTLSPLASAVVAQPSLPSDASAEARAEYAHWTDGSPPSNHCDPNHEFAVAAVAKLLVEILKNAGRDLSRESVIATLESRREFRTGFVPPLLFTPRRHSGATGLYIISAPSSRDRPPSEWIQVE